MPPTYDWACDCGFEHTEFDFMSGPKIKSCPKCKNNTLHRLIGAGSGFHSSTSYVDAKGEKIYFKEPYFDTAMRRAFKSAKEKFEFMKEKGIASKGDSDEKVNRERKEHHEMKMDTKKEKVNA